MFYARDRGEWREWLEKNHATAPGVRLIYYKKGSGLPRIPYDDAVEEALCFGWIDSKVNKLDDERYIQIFSPRKAKSSWSKSNKERVERLVRQGSMAPAGLEKVEIAKRNGKWDEHNDIEDLLLPEDLVKTLNANRDASRHFEAFSDAAKKMTLRWIHSAKRPETRAKRIEEAVGLAAKNITVGQNRK